VIKFEPDDLVTITATVYPTRDHLAALGKIFATEGEQT
jgi:hypothetical protein